MLLLLIRLLFFLHLPFVVILRELALLLRLFSDKKTLFAISFHSGFVLGNLHSLIDIELEDLDESSISILLWTLEIEALVEHDFG